MENTDGLKCPECNSTNNITIKSETICKKCGLVLKGTNPYVAGIKINYPYGFELYTEY